MESDQNITLKQIREKGKTFSHVDHVQCNPSKPDDIESVQIDGNKVIAFIRTVELLASILNKINVVEVKDAFLLGKKCDSVEKVLAMKTMWLDTFRMIQLGMKDSADEIIRLRDYHRNVLAIIKMLSNTIQTKEFERGIVKAKELADLCDRLDKHRQSGLLDIVTKI
jgi:hypothetical protein